MPLTLSAFDISRIVPVYEVICIRSFMKAEKAKVCRNMLSFSSLKQCLKGPYSLLRPGESVIIIRCL